MNAPSRSQQSERSATGRLGGTATATGGTTWSTLCRLEDDGRPWAGTVYTSTGPISQPSDTPSSMTPPVANPRVVIRVKTGSKNVGGGGAMTVMYALAGNPIPFAGTFCEVSALVAPNETADFSEETGLSPFDPDVTAEVTGFIAIGVGGKADQLMATSWRQPEQPLASAEQVTIGPSRIRAVQGYNHGASAAYLMFFDDADGRADISAGAVPLFTIPVGGLPASPGGDVTFSDDFITSARVFQYGIYWAISSTADTFTADSSNLFRVDIELYDQQQRIE